MRVSYINIIVSDLKSRKFSTLLTLFAISLGILSIFLIIVISQGFQDSLQKEFMELGTNKIIVQPEGALPFASGGRTLVDDDYKIIEHKPYVKAVYPIYFIMNNPVRYGNEFRKTQVTGTFLSKNSFTDFNLKLALGRYPKENEKHVAVVGSEFAYSKFSKDVKIGTNIYINGVKFKVIGILQSLGNPQDDSAVYVPLDTLRDIYGLGDKISMINVIVPENYNVNLAAENLQRIYDNRLGKNVVEVNTMEQFLESFNSVLDIIKLTLGGIALISLIVGALGIINTMFVIITERTKDIGIMKAIGARNSDIFLIYVSQSSIFGLLGGIFGIIFGSFFALIFEKWAFKAGYTYLSITITPLVVGFMLLLSIFIGFISGFIPSYRASKLNIIEAIRK